MSDIDLSASQLREFAVTRQCALIAAAAIAVALSICFMGSPDYQAVIWIVLGPLMMGAAFALVSQADWSRQVNGWREDLSGAVRRRRRRLASSHAISRARYTRAAWHSGKHPEGIVDVHAKAAVRVSGIAYFWSLMILVLVLAVWIIVSLIVAAIVLVIVSWFLGGRSTLTSAGREAIVDRFGKRVTKGVFGTSDTRIDEKGNVFKTGGLTEQRVGRIDADGTIFTSRACWARRRRGGWMPTDMCIGTRASSPRSGPHKSIRTAPLWMATTRSLKRKKPRPPRFAQTSMRNPGVKNAIRVAASLWTTTPLLS